MYDIIGHGRDGEQILLETFDTLTESRHWVNLYTRWGDFGGYESITCNAVPFNGDYEFAVHAD